MSPWRKPLDLTGIGERILKMTMRMHDTIRGVSLYLDYLNDSGVDQRHFQREYMRMTKQRLESLKEEIDKVLERME